SIRISPAIYKKVCRIIKKKITARVYELSNLLYCSRWFCVLKKDDKSLRLVHSLEPLNRVTIVHSGLPPAIEELAMHFTGRACNGILDLYVRYDEHILAKLLYNLTIFQTPFGAMNSVPIFYKDVTYILCDKIPEYILPYIDDVPIQGPASRYEHEDGTCEIIPANSEIRQFVWEHLNIVNQILVRMKYTGRTFSGPKTTIIADQITIVEFEFEQPHWDLRQMLYKTIEGDIKKWFWNLHHVMWADRITVRKGTGCSPYFLVTEAYPTIPLDVIEAIWLVKYPDRLISTTELVGL
ncbi:hypothetical protein AN958_12715, partial [Leucoagaricus sp. SymC.cos]